MRVFLQHIGSPGNIDVAFTVTKKRSVDELIEKLPASATGERDWFGGDTLRDGFADGNFNCWGVPPGAESMFRRTRPGDLVLIMPTGGDYGAIEHIGVVKAVCPIEAWNASRILWPKTPDDRLFPFVFFFNTESATRSLTAFLQDVGWASNWRPRGRYLSVAADRFDRFGGPEGYLDFLRRECGFK